MAEKISILSFYNDLYDLISCSFETDITASCWKYFFICRKSRFSHIANLNRFRYNNSSNTIEKCSFNVEKDLRVIYHMLTPGPIFQQFKQKKSSNMC